MRLSCQWEGGWARRAKVCALRFPACESFVQIKFVGDGLIVGLIEHELHTAQIGLSSDPSMPSTLLSMEMRLERTALQHVNENSLNLHSCPSTVLMQPHR